MMILFFGNIPAGHAQGVGPQELPRIVLLLSHGDSADTRSDIMEAVSSQLRDLPVIIEPVAVSVSGKGGETPVTMAMHFSATGARVVVWLDPDSPGVVWFLAAEASGPSRYRRRFQSNAATSLDLESLAQICRGTVQVLIDMESFHEEAETSSLAHVTETEPQASPVSPEYDVPDSKDEMETPPPLLELNAAYVYRAFSAQSPVQSGVYAGLSLRIGSIWRLALGVEPYVQSSEDTAIGCFRARVKPIPIGLETSAVWRIGAGRFSLGPTAAFVVSIDKASYDWYASCAAGEDGGYKERSETSASVHQEIGVVARFLVHRRVTVVLTLAADVLLHRAVYFENKTIDSETGYTLRMERLPVAPRVALGVAFGAV